MPTKKERKRCHKCGRRLTMDQMEYRTSSYSVYSHYWFCIDQDQCIIMHEYFKRVHSGSRMDTSQAGVQNAGKMDTVKLM